MNALCRMYQPPPHCTPHTYIQHYNIHRLRMVKNTNFFWDSKKICLTYWKTVFWIPEHFCIKWMFWKNGFFCPKNAFFWQKWKFDHLLRAAPRRSQGTFFSGGNFTPIFEAKKVGTSGQKCPGHFDSSQFSPKSANFWGFEKKSFWKWLEPKTYCVCYPNTLLYMVLDHLWAKKCHDFGQRL